MENAQIRCLRHQGKRSVSPSISHPIPHFLLPFPKPPHLALKSAPPATASGQSNPYLPAREPPPVGLLPPSSPRPRRGSPGRRAALKSPESPTTTLPRSPGVTSADWAPESSILGGFDSENHHPPILVRVASRDGVAAVQRGAAVPAGQLRQRRRDSHPPRAGRWS